MWLYVVIALVAFSVGVLLMLIVRFVQPELIYAVRHAIVNVRTNKAFLDADAEVDGAGQAFRELLADDRRIETYDYDEKYVLGRVLKIRQLYRILIRKPPKAPAKARKPQECIVELADLLGNLGWHVTPDQKFNYHSTVHASAILGFIRDQINKGAPRLGGREANEVEAWFEAHPISIEQAIEILSSAVFALAYRQRVQGAGRTDCDGPSGGSEGSDGGAKQPAGGDKPVAGSPLGLVGIKPSRTAGGTRAPGGATPAPTPETPQTPETPRPEPEPEPEGELIKIFVSYSHLDEKYLGDDSLLGTLKALEREGVRFWSDQEITAGDKWDERIRDEIRGSHVALVLVSQAYLNSAYCQNVEINEFLTGEERDGLAILPVMLSACEWERSEWLRSRRFLPGGGKTVEGHYTTPGKRKELFVDVLKQMRKLVEGIRAGARRGRGGA